MCKFDILSGVFLFDNYIKCVMLRNSKLNSSNKVDINIYRKVYMKSKRKTLLLFNCLTFTISEEHLKLTKII
jgi:hypothetical protein